MKRKYDVVILGTGNAGMAAAGVVRAAGRSVAMVESRDVGGTCPIRGCVPKKVLVAAAQVLHQIDTAARHHIKVDRPVLDWTKLIEREQSFVEGVPEAFADSLESRGIDLFTGNAAFTGPHTVAVGGDILEADKIVIATGSTPRKLPIPGAEHMVTSDDILVDTTLPGHLIFIGGGVIALEFGHVLARAGTRVTILEAMPTLLPRMEQDAVRQIHKESERIGIEIIIGVKVQQVSRRSNQLDVRFEVDGETRTLAADVVANGAGRIPNLDGLDLEAAGIDLDGLRIMVDPQLRSISNPNVYVAGDALSSSAQLSPVATYEGRFVANKILGNDTDVADYAHFPANVYTVPALASVGLTEAEAEEKELKFTAKTNDMTGWRSARTHAETVAWSKVLVDDDTDQILGAHLVGHGAEETIHLLSFAMKHGVTAKELAEEVYAYPTFTSDIKYMV